MSSSRELIDTQDRLTRAINRVRAGNAITATTFTRERGEQFINLLYNLIRMVFIYDINNRVFEAPTSDIAEVFESLYSELGTIRLIAVEDQIYLNDIRIRFDVRTDTALYLSKTFNQHDIGGFSFHNPLLPQQWRQFIELIHLAPAKDWLNPRQSFLHDLVRSGIDSISLSPIHHFQVDDEELAEDKGKADFNQHYQEATQALETLWRAQAAGRSPSMLPLRILVQQMTEVYDYDQEQQFISVHQDISGSQASRHAIQVCLLSTLIGRELGMPQSECEELGLAALVHDQGYTLDENGYPPPFERHGSAGVRVQMRARGFHESRVRRLLVCAQHHRNFDYPRPPTLLARIVHIADDYDNLTRHRPNGPVYVPPLALAHMMTASGTSYDPVLLQIFINRMGRYPPGTLLQLQDGSRVVVISGVRAPHLFDKPLTLLTRTPDGDKPTSPVSIDLADVQEVKVVTPDGLISVC